MTDEEMERIEFNAWKSKKAEYDRKRGDYWLSQEGRQEIRDTWEDPNDGNCVLPLLNAIEQAESKLIRPNTERMVALWKARRERYKRYGLRNEVFRVLVDEVDAVLAEWPDVIAMDRVSDHGE